MTPKAPAFPSAEERSRLASIRERLHTERGDYWQVQRCPSCDDHGGHDQEWSVWSGGAQGLRVAHGLYQHEALTIAKHVNALREVMDECAGLLARIAPPTDSSGGATALDSREAELKRRFRLTWTRWLDRDDHDAENLLAALVVDARAIVAPASAVEAAPEGAHEN